jgi:hypothetical protein
MRSKRLKNRILYRVFAIVLAAFTIFFIPAEYTASAATSGEIVSRDDFYDKVSEQFYTRELLQIYPLTNPNLGKDLVHMDWHSYSTHYNPEKPLKSGCYLIYYIDSITLTYTARTLKSLVSYRYTGGEMDRHFEKMNSLAQQLRGKNDFETVTNVHDYLIKNYEYDSRAELGNHTDIEGFRDGVMVCTGYSMATYYILNTLGINTRIIVGFGGTPEEAKNGTDENHMWNMVQVDGKWYNLDVTWDDGGGDRISYDYFLKSDAEFPGHRRLGIYADSSFSAMLSQESYALPLVMRSQVAQYWYIYVILLAVMIYVILRYRKRIKEAREAADDLPDWNPEDGMGPYRDMGGFYPNSPGSPYGAGQPLNPQGTVPPNSQYYANRTEGEPLDPQFSDDPYATYDAAQHRRDYASYDPVLPEQKPDSKYSGNPYAAEPVRRDYPDPGMGAYTSDIKNRPGNSSEHNGEGM